MGPLEHDRSHDGYPAASVGRASKPARAALERAGSREPANRGLAHTVGARQIGLHSAVSEPLEGLLALVGCQLDRAAEFHASGLGALAALRLPVGEAARAAAWATRPNLMTQHAQIAEHKYSRPHARPFCLRFARVVAVFPVCAPAPLYALGRPGPSPLAAVNLAPAVRHGCRSAGLACPLGPSTAAGSSVRPNQGLKARPHALALARKRFIAHF